MIAGSRPYSEVAIVQRHAHSAGIWGRKKSSASFCAYSMSVRLVGHCLLDEGCAFAFLFCTESAVRARAMVT